MLSIAPRNTSTLSDVGIEDYTARGARSHCITNVLDHDVAFGSRNFNSCRKAGKRSDFLSIVKDDQRKDRRAKRRMVSRTGFSLHRLSDLWCFLDLPLMKR